MVATSSLCSACVNFLYISSHSLNFTDKNDIICILIERTYCGFTNEKRTGMGFFKRKTISSDKEKKEKESIKIVGDIAVNRTAQKYAQKFMGKYTKAKEYDRGLYDSAIAKAQAKHDVLSSGIPKDPYTGEVLFVKQKDAKFIAGEEDAYRMMAEADHIYPLKKIYDENKNKRYITDEDIRNVGNSQDNLQVISRKLNNAKRDRTQEEFFGDSAYLEKENIYLSDNARKQGIARGIAAKKFVQGKLSKSAMAAGIESAKEAGRAGASYGAKSTAMISGIINISSLIKGEKSVEDAMADVTADTLVAAAKGYGKSAVVANTNYILQTSKLSFCKKLGENNASGKLITAVSLTGDTIVDFANGDITEEECVIRLGGAGVNYAGSSVGAAIGSALIPIPVVGQALGAWVGGALCNDVYNGIIADIQEERRLEEERAIRLMIAEYERRKHEERERILANIYTAMDVLNAINMIRNSEVMSTFINEIKLDKEIHEENLRRIAEATFVALQMNEYRRQLEGILDSKMEEYKICFSESLEQIRSSIECGDVNEAIAGTNRIVNKMNGKAAFADVDGFKRIITSGSTIEF